MAITPMYRVRTIFTGVAGSPYYNNLYFETAGGTAAQAKADVSSFWTNVAPNIASAVTWTVQGDVYIIDPVTGDIIGLSSSPNVTGTGTGGVNVLPPATQGLVRLLTGVFQNGRQVRGRMFIPSPVEGINVDPGVPIAATITQINNAAAATITSGTSTWSVWSKVNGEHFPITSATMWNQWSVLRSRRD